MDIFISRKTWQTFSEEETEEYVKAVFDYYRERGFPYYPTDEDWRRKEYDKLRRFVEAGGASFDENDNLKQSMHGLSLAWSFFPHMFDVRCNGMKTPREVFDSDELFMKAIRKRMRLGDNMSDAGIRKMLKIFTGAQAVSNFRPTAACAIYNRYAPNGVVWDMSAGYGGRLLGFYVSSARKYIGTDPCLRTMESLFDMERFLTSNYGSKGIELDLMGSENFTPVGEVAEPVDLCFTSPPYFDTEHYSDEETQSYIKFPNRESWTNGFLRKTFENCHTVLKPDGKMAINIANTRTFPDLEDTCVKTAESVGFKLIKTHKYLLSALNSGGFKGEPVFVFSK